MVHARSQLAAAFLVVLGDVSIDDVGVKEPAPEGCRSAKGEEMNSSRQDRLAVLPLWHTRAVASVPSPVLGRRPGERWYPSFPDEIVPIEGVFPARDGFPGVKRHR